MKAVIRYKGGKGSGFKGHVGRPGFVGGSSREGSTGQTISFGGTKGTAVGQAYDTRIAIDKNYYSTLSESGKNQLIAHELAHNIVEDKILSNNDEWNRASDALLIKVVERDKAVYHQFILGQSRIGEAMVETIAVYTQGHANPFANFVPSFTQPKPSWNQDKWDKAMNWAEHALKYVGLSKERFNGIVTKLRKDLDNELYNMSSVTKQLPIDEASRLRLVEVRMGIFDSDIDILSEKMFVGDITLGQWEESAKRLIRELHSSVATIYKGGWDQMTWADWGRLGPVLKGQYKYLHGFAQAIADARDTISLRAIQARAHMYGDSAMQSANKVTTHLAIEKQLPWMPREGEGVGMEPGNIASCLVRCCCFWKLDVIGKEKDFNIVRAVWRLSPAEHCDICIKRDGHEEIIRVYKDIPVPDHIGFYCGEIKELNILKGGKGSGFRGHLGGKGGKGNPGGSQSIGSGGLSKDESLSGLPKLPKELFSGSSGNVMNRQRERASIMESVYGVKFSAVSSNPLAVVEGKKLDAKGVGIPRAIYNKDVNEITDSAIHSRILEAYKRAPKPPVGGYVTYTQLKFESEVSFQDLFGSIKYWKSKNPYAVYFTVDRLGNNTAVKLDVSNL